MANNLQQTYRLEVQDNELLAHLVGPHDRHLKRIEQRLGIRVALRGNTLVLNGDQSALSYAQTALQYLISQLAKGFSVGTEEVEAAVRIASATVDPGNHTAAPAEETLSIATKRRMVFPRSAMQAEYIRALQKHDMVFGLGPAGTGKTYLAAAVGVSLLLSGQVERIILSRPAVEAGERLGFLPGDMREKVDPYLRPLYDALYDMLPSDLVERKLASGEIEIAPLAFMRGRTLGHAFVILDEAQNTSAVQMQMFLTRLGQESRMVITGDLSQIDLPAGMTSGLKEARRILKNVPGIRFVEFTDQDVVRHHLVSDIIRAYDADHTKAGKEGDK